MEDKRLPRTPLMMENASFIMQGDKIQAWPLLCDPTARVTSWVNSFLSDKGLVTVKYSVSKILDSVLHIWENISISHIVHFSTSH